MADSGKKHGKDNNEGRFYSYEKEEIERIQKARGKRKKRVFRRRVLSFLFIILLILCLGFIIIKTPLFNVEAIEIEGNNFVSDEEILVAAKVSEGENIFTHSSGYMESQLEKLPYISRAEVQKKFPSGIYITVYEENEFALLELPDKLVSCDKNGKSIRVVSESETENLIVIKGCSEGDFVPGEYVKFSDEAKTELFYRCLGAATDYGLLNIAALDITDEDKIIFNVKPSLVIKLGEMGNEDELSYKMAYIREVMDNLPQNISGIIDATNVEAGVSYRTGEFEHDTLAEAEGSTEETENEEGSGEEATEEEEITETE